MAALEEVDESGVGFVLAAKEYFCDSVGVANATQRRTRLAAQTDACVTTAQPLWTRLVARFSVARLVA